MKKLIIIIITGIAISGCTSMNTKCVNKKVYKKHKTQFTKVYENKVLIDSHCKTNYEIRNKVLNIVKDSIKFQHIDTLYFFETVDDFNNYHGIIWDKNNIIFFKKTSNNKIIINDKILVSYFEEDIRHDVENLTMKEIYCKKNDNEVQGGSTNYVTRIIYTDTKKHIECIRYNN